MTIATVNATRQWDKDLKILKTINFYTSNKTIIGR